MPGSQVQTNPQKKAHCASRFSTERERHPRHRCQLNSEQTKAARLHISLNFRHTAVWVFTLAEIICCFSHSLKTVPDIGDEAHHTENHRLREQPAWRMSIGRVDVPGGRRLSLGFPRLPVHRPRTVIIMTANMLHTDSESSGRLGLQCERRLKMFPRCCHIPYLGTWYGPWAIRPWAIRRQQCLAQLAENSFNSILNLFGINKAAFVPLFNSSLDMNVFLFFLRQTKVSLLSWNS